MKAILVLFFFATAFAISDKDLFNYLKSKGGYNNYGAAGLMGNLYSESGLKPNNLENYYNTKLGLSDEEYTRRVDNGQYTNFVRDSAGYGYAQWTYWSRKQNLLNYKKKKGTSIGDANMQLEFLVSEIKSDFAGVAKTLKSAKTVREASDAVLLKFERPADTSEAVRRARAKKGQEYYDKYHS